MGREAILGLIPHGEGMCLLDEITFWDAERIVCRTATHRDPNNPLHDGTGLPAFCALEYGAQAMAAHGALLARSQGRSVPPGWLASVREARFLAPRLDTFEDALEVEARAVSSVGGFGAGFGGGSVVGGSAYGITISCGDAVIASARLIVAAVA